MSERYSQFMGEHMDPGMFKQGGEIDEDREPEEEGENGNGGPDKEDRNSVEQFSHRPKRDSEERTSTTEELTEPVNVENRESVESGIENLKARLAKVQQELRELRDSPASSVLNGAFNLDEIEQAAAAAIAEIDKRWQQTAERPQTTKEALVRILDNYLDRSSYQNLVNLLRLDQTIGVYCSDPVETVAPDIRERAQTLYNDAAPLREGVAGVKEALGYLGIQLAPIEFFKEHPEGWEYSENTDGPALVLLSDSIAELACDRVRHSLRRDSDLRRTVGDVSTWGFTCDHDPKLQSSSRLWIARSWENK